MDHWDGSDDDDPEDPKEEGSDKDPEVPKEEVGVREMLKCKCYILDRFPK